MGRQERQRRDPTAERTPSGYHLLEGAKILRRIQADAAELRKRGYRIVKTAEKADGFVMDITDDFHKMDISGALLDKKHPLYFEGSLLSEDDAQLLTPEQAAELLGLQSIEALYKRIYRAERRDEPHPFWKTEGSRSYLAHRVDVVAWGETLTGKRRVRGPRKSRSDRSEA